MADATAGQDAAGTPGSAHAGADDRSPDRSVLLKLALFALRESRTREELLDHAARITAAALGGDLSKVLERVPPGAEQFLTTAGSGWTAADAVVGVLTIPGGGDASPSGRADATGAVQRSSAEPGAPPDASHLPEPLARVGVRSALDASIPRAGQATGHGHGVLQADSRKPAAFGTADEALLKDIAEVLGAALDADDRQAAAAKAVAGVQALLAAEAEHRIANSLQAVASALALQARLASDDPRVTAPLLAAAARVAAAGAVHRHLHRVVAAGASTDGTASVDAAALLHTVCGDLAAMLAGPTAEGERHLTCDAEPFPWPAVRARALATIAVELAMNAAKHASHGMIRLRLSPARDGDALLTAEDDGPGFPSDFDMKQGPGLGLRLIHALAGPGDARVTVGSDKRGGRIEVRIARTP